MKYRSEVLLSTAVLLTVSVSAQAEDWARFRGPNGTGIATDSSTVPVKWSDTENLKWKTPLPGPGSSCPIVVGGRVFVTCWSGYGTNREDPGDQEDLKRHLLCFDRSTGKQLWEAKAESVLPEDPYSGMFTQHGYASHTPVSDGERVYVFYGKTGALAFDMDGKQLWQHSVGTESGIRGWGTASSPVLYKNLLIVTASAESEALVALNKTTGEEVWRQEAAGFSGTWGTPILVDSADGRTDLVIAVPYEIWGFDPDTGKLRWYCDGIQSDSMCSSLVAQGDIVYAIERGPRGGGAMAVRVGGKGDVTKTHVVWTANESSRIGTPILFEGRLHWISSGVANCIDAKTGDRVYQTRLPSTGTSSASGGQGGGRSSGRGRGRGGFGGSQDYASPVVADGRLYFMKRAGTTLVITLGESAELISQNRFASDSGDFSATPAISNGDIFIRSSNNLYCVATKE